MIRLSLDKCDSIYTRFNLKSILPLLLYWNNKEVYLNPFYKRFFISSQWFRWICFSLNLKNHRHFSTKTRLSIQNVLCRTAFRFTELRCSYISFTWILSDLNRRKRSFSFCVRGNSEYWNDTVNEFAKRYRTQKWNRFLRRRNERSWEFVHFQDFTFFNGETYFLDSEFSSQDFNLYRDEQCSVSIYQPKSQAQTIDSDIIARMIVKFDLENDSPLLIHVE